MASCYQDQTLRQNIVIGTNVLLHLVSFLLFLGYFGVPSIEKYLEKQTIIVTSEEQTNGIRAPAVTIFATEKSVLGWKTLDQSTIEDTTSFDQALTGFRLVPHFFFKYPTCPVLKIENG